MKLETFDFSGNAERIVKDAFDCVWLWLSPRQVPRPLEAETLQCVDWKLQGQISRLICSIRPGGSSTTFFHTMKKLDVPYVCAEVAESCDWQLLRKNCEGMKLKRVLLFLEDSSKIASAQTEVGGIAWGDFPEYLILGYEHRAKLNG